MSSQCVTAFFIFLVRYWSTSGKQWISMNCEAGVIVFLILQHIVSWQKLEHKTVLLWLNNPLSRTCVASCNLVARISSAHSCPNILLSSLLTGSQSRTHWTLLSEWRRLTNVAHLWPLFSNLLAVASIPIVIDSNLYAFVWEADINMAYFGILVAIL